MTRLLWIEDDAALRRVFRPLLTGEGYQVTEAASEPEARAALGEATAGEGPELVLLDLMLPPTGTVEGGLALLEAVLGRHPTAKVVVLSGAGDRSASLEAIRRGAHDFLAKPLDPDVLLVVLERARKLQAMERTLVELREELAAARPNASMIGRSPLFLQALELADRVAPTLLPVLVRGENGTGKELLARRVHQQSLRAEGPFVAVNCGALAPTLLESTLFGHTAGAFTGAKGARNGVFVEASGGTLFLDEIGDMDPASQVRLLRAIENQEVVPVGADRPVAVDVRIVSATHRDLAEARREGAFRDDLYWRLCGVEIGLPPLRDRPDDLPLLARHFAAEAAHVVGRGVVPTLADDALAAMRAHPWPGNLRELRHAVQRGAVLAQPATVITAQHLGLQPVDGPDGTTLAEQVERVERRAIAHALALEGGNRTRAAKRLGLSRQGLLNKLARYELDS